MIKCQRGILIMGKSIMCKVSIPYMSQFKLIKRDDIKDVITHFKKTS